MRRISGAARRAFGVCAAALLFAGCGSPAPNVVSLPIPPAVGTGTAARDDWDVSRTTGSWMSPDAKHENLVYVSNISSNSVSVYDFSTRKMVGKLTGIIQPYGLCSDSSGNVWVVGWGKNQLTEYAHASVKPLKKLSIRGWQISLISCSVDPTTGNLAVTNYGPDNWYHGNVFVFPNGRGWPASYYADGLWFYFGCSYDDKGNLWINGWNAYLNYNLALGLLPKGSKTLQALPVSPAITPLMLGNIQAVGSVLVLGDWESVIEVVVKGSIGFIRGYTMLTTHFPVGLFEVTTLGGKEQIIAPDYAGHPYAVQYWKYPRGGDPTATITNGLSGSFGVTVSVVPPS
jgi:YVTN family beta-propeller protein